MIGFFDALKVGTGAIVAAALVYPLAHHLGQSEGRRQVATAALEKTVELLQSRERTNAEISSSDAAALCAHLGLQDDDRRECVRRLAAAQADARNSRQDHDGR